MGSEMCIRDRSSAKRPVKPGAVCLSEPACAGGGGSSGAGSGAAAVRAVGRSNDGSGGRPTSPREALSRTPYVGPMSWLPHYTPRPPQKEQQLQLQLQQLQARARTLELAQERRRHSARRAGASPRARSPELLPIPHAAQADKADWLGGAAVQNLDGTRCTGTPRGVGGRGGVDLCVLSARCRHAVLCTHSTAHWSASLMCSSQ